MFSQHRQRVWSSCGRRTPLHFPFSCGTLQTPMVFLCTSLSAVCSLPRSGLCLRTAWICFYNVLHSSNSRAWNTTSVRLSSRIHSFRQSRGYKFLKSWTRPPPSRQTSFATLSSFPLQETEHNLSSGPFWTSPRSGGRNLSRTSLPLCSETGPRSSCPIS